MPPLNPPLADNATLPAQEIGYREGERRFAPFANLAGSVWLDSGSPAFPQSRYEIIAINPERSRRVESPHLDDRHNVFTLMDQWQPEARSSDLPFHGGTIGYLGYEMNQSLERLSPSPAPVCELPVAWLAYYPWALVQDVVARRSWLVAENSQALARGITAIEAADRAPTPTGGFELVGPWIPSSTEEEYLAGIHQVQQWISAGDCYQVNLSRHFQAGWKGHAWAAYRCLREALPSPFSAFINTGHGYLMSHSPERLLLVENGEVTTSPIKGTRPRGASPEDDLLLAQQLLASSKDRAENLMIVDLLRNDLGRSCQPGSIQVEKLFQLQSYPNVHHLVSTIKGRLAEGVSAAQALRNAFPGGSITGAPKIRAMDIINQLEPVARSAYCGSVFYLSNHGRLDSNIAIRTLALDKDSIHCWGGGGIVADSQPQEECAESITKIEVLLQALTEVSR